MNMHQYIGYTQPKTTSELIKRLQEIEAEVGCLPIVFNHHNNKTTDCTGCMALRVVNNQGTVIITTIQPNK